MDTIDTISREIQNGDRVALARAITLIESRHPNHRKKADDILTFLGQPMEYKPRIAITGPPGVGKSSLIEALGLYLVKMMKYPAVLTIDPSSSLTKGSILGDRTRMESLSKEEKVFIRQTPSSNHLGGVAPRTRETLMICEHAGFDLTIVETVGVGQSEFDVHDLCDLVIFLVLPGSGDELQGVKKGIMEMADIFVVQKSDGALMDSARQTTRSLKNAVRLLQPKYPEIKRPVLQVSALERKGIDELWSTIAKQHQSMLSNGILDKIRREQNHLWLKELIEDRWMERLKLSSAYKERKTRWEDSNMDIKEMFQLVRAILKEA